MIRLLTISGPVLAHAFAAGLFATAVVAQDATTDIGMLDKTTAEKMFPAKPPYSPYAGRNFPTRPYFGDTHTHTSYSMDAGAFGARLSPKDAYRFAKGEELTVSSGQRAKLSRPLDFLVVTDHSDGMGFFPQLVGGDPTLLATPKGRKWYDEINSGKGAQAAIDIITSFGKNQMPKGFPTPGTPAYRSAWRETIKAAEEANEPGRFTAFIGYEWTSNDGGNNLHRNVIWRDNGAKASLVEPFTTLPPLGSPNPRDLWKWMAMVEEKTGAELLAIAHNGNLSNGRMFPIIESSTRNKLIVNTPRTVFVGSRFTRPRRSRVTARRIRFCRPTMNSPTSSAGTRATWTSPKLRSQRCWNSSTHARRSRTVSRWKPNSG